MAVRPSRSRCRVWQPRAIAGLLLVFLIATTARAQQDRSPDVALSQLLDEVRATIAAPCARPGTDRLARILCERRIRIGVRDYYPLFSARDGEQRVGYEIYVAETIARRLGVEIEYVRVNAASRIAMLAEDHVDLSIATMGHNTQRDGQARFIRPHYYQSETILVGLRGLAIDGWSGIAGRTICVTVGNGSNAQIVSHGARLMLFDEAGQLPARLKDGTCTLAAQDDSFFAYYFLDPDFAQRFEPKFGFAQVPWGMAVARESSGRLGRALDLVSQILHRDGAYLALARQHRIGTAFLERQQAVWQRPECGGAGDKACVLPPLDAELQPTSIARRVGAIEDWVEDWTGINLTLPMLKTLPAWSLFADGVVNSLILVAGALLATLGFALLLGAALSARNPAVRWPARLLTVTLQSSPIVLTLVIAAAVAQAMVPFSATVALAAAIVALGLTNGSNAGQAISEALRTLRSERAAAMPAAAHHGLFARAVSRAGTQVVAFLVNAAKGTPIASFIGAPELLSALTDITSFSSGRATTYSLLLIFYIVVVMVVVWLCGRLRLALEQRHVPA